MADRDARRRALEFVPLLFAALGAGLLVYAATLAVVADWRLATSLSDPLASFDRSAAAIAVVGGAAVGAVASDRGAALTAAAGGVLGGYLLLLVATVVGVWLLGSGIGPTDALESVLESPELVVARGLGLVVAACVATVAGDRLASTSTDRGARR